jgi:hypothetical protein
VVDHVCRGLKSEFFSVKSGVVETIVSMRCLRSPSEEVEVAWETSASAACCILGPMRSSLEARTNEHRHPSARPRYPRSQPIIYFRKN